jgi:hypothetical protein
MTQEPEWIMALPPPDHTRLTDVDHVNLKNMIELIFPEMVGDLSSSQNAASMYEPFQPLLRHVITAAAQYFTDHGYDDIAGMANQLLDGGKLNSPQVARAPQAAEVARLIQEKFRYAARTRDHDDLDAALHFMQTVIADAMDCARKQALGVPPG